MVEGEMRFRFSLFLLLAGLLSAGASSQEETLGRLFFTPTQRATLERQRQQGLNSSQNPPELAGSQTFNGEVRRSDGRNTRWINGEVNWDRPSAAPRIPVGDTLYPASGEHQSLIGNGQIVIKPSAKR